jgi:hypothetical protein
LQKQSNIQTWQRSQKNDTALKVIRTLYITGGEDMELTVFLLLALVAFIVTIASAMGKAPLWIAVLLLCIIELLREIPLK